MKTKIVITGLAIALTVTAKTSVAEYQEKIRENLDQISHILETSIRNPKIDRKLLMKEEYPSLKIGHVNKQLDELRTHVKQMYTTLEAIGPIKVNDYESYSAEINNAFLALSPACQQTQKSVTFIEDIALNGGTWGYVTLPTLEDLDQKLEPNLKSTEEAIAQSQQTHNTIRELDQKIKTLDNMVTAMHNSGDFARVVSRDSRATNVGNVRQDLVRAQNVTAAIETLQKNISKMKKTFGDLVEEATTNLAADQLRWTQLQNECRVNREKFAMISNLMQAMKDGKNVRVVVEEGSTLAAGK